MIILEGPDGSGKSHLLERMKKPDSAFYRWGKRHYSKSDFRWMLHDLWADPDRFIYDRAYLSEQIYGPLLRDEDKIGKSGRRMLDRVALSKQGIVVLCIPPFEVAKKAWASRKEEELIQDGNLYNQLYSEYLSLETDLPIIQYDWTVDTYMDLERRLLEAMPNKNLGYGIGNYSGSSTLLVGDMVKHRGQFEACFCWDQGSAPWLADKLEEASIPEDRLYWINARNYLGRVNPADFIEKMNPENIVALGNKAASWCDNNSLAYEKVKHPQYWKRFKSKEEYPLIPLLKERISGLQYY